jgi:hypothetical protein
VKSYYDSDPNFKNSIVSVVVFFVLLNYHTPFSIPWVFPPLAFYGLDLLLRLLRYRVKEATLLAQDNTMTLVINGVDLYPFSLLIGP